MEMSKRRAGASARDDPHSAALPGAGQLDALKGAVSILRDASYAIRDELEKQHDDLDKAAVGELSWMRGSKYDKEIIWSHAKLSSVGIHPLLQSESKSSTHSEKL